MNIALLGLEGDFVNSAGAGIQRYMFNLYENLKKLTTNCNYVNISGGHPPYIRTPPDIEKIEITKLPIIGTGFSFSLKTFFLNLNEFDIVHQLMPLTSYSRPKILRNNILIMTVHDFYHYPGLHPELVDIKNIPFKERLWMNLITIPAAKNILLSDFLIADSDQTKKEAIKLGFNKNKVFTVNLGVDYRYFSDLKPKTKQKSFRLGYLGGLNVNKNLPFAINAVNAINSNDIKFEIWGNKTWSYNHLKNLIKNKNISLQGFAPENKIINIYDSFDVFLFPSLCEGFGLPILEAQARGLPVIIYKNGQISKEVRKYCFEAESPEHMAQIITDLKENGYNEKLRKKAMDYARTFTWEKTANETLEVYKKIM